MVSLITIYLVIILLSAAHTFSIIGLQPNISLGCFFIPFNRHQKQLAQVVINLLWKLWNQVSWDGGGIQNLTLGEVFWLKWKSLLLSGFIWHFYKELVTFNMLRRC